jgi:hypothetical protein
MAPRTLPDISYIHECLRYNPETGEFIWRIRPPHHFRRFQYCKAWNTGYAGRPAGTAKDRYVRIPLHGAEFYAHRIAWLLIHGAPVPEFLDHADGNKLNNRISNLRAATKAQNYMNSPTRPSKSGVKGVFPKPYPRGIRFAAFIKLAGKRYHLGQFATLEEAAEARREAAERLHGAFARHR